MKGVLASILGAGVKEVNEQMVNLPSVKLAPGYFAAMNIVVISGQCETDTKIDVELELVEWRKEWQGIAAGTSMDTDFRACFRVLKSLLSSYQCYQYPKFIYSIG